MKFSFRILTCIIALLIAGKEVVAFGHAMSTSDDVSWSTGLASLGDCWLLEHEAEEETEEKSTDDFGFEDCLHTFISRNRDIVHQCKSSLYLSEFEFLLRNTEFYIYVLNLRL